MRYLPFVLGIAEIVLFVAVAVWIGLGWTILLALLTSVVGFFAFQREGLRAWSSLRESVAAGSAVDQFELRERLKGTGSRMLAAFLLMLPGFLTDALGLALLLPPIREGIGQRLAFSAFQNFPARGRDRGNWPGDSVGRDGQAARNNSTVIEGEVIEEPGEDPDGT